MTFRVRLSTYLRARDRGWILSLIASVCLVYLPFLGNPFIFDDASLLQDDFMAHFAHSLFSFELRWWPYASLGWTYVTFSNENTYFYHVGNLLLHAASVITLFYLLRQLTGTVITESKNSVSMIWGAWFGALIFAVHPVAVYAVEYIIQRSILMATLFVLLMQLAYVRGLLTGQGRWMVLTVLSYFMAVYSKEHSVLAPLLLAAETVLLRGEIKTSARSLWITWGALFAVAVQIVLLAKGVIGTPYETGAAALFEQQDIVASTPMLHLLSMMTQAGLFFKYLLLLILPNPAWMSIDMREPFISSLGQWQGWLGAVGYIAYGAFSFWLLMRPRWPGLVGLALLYPWLLFLLEFSSIRVQEIFVLYRSYLWLPGLLLIIPFCTAKWNGKKAVIILGLISLLLLPLAWNRLWVMGDNFRLWNDAAKLLQTGQEPLASRIYYNRANAEASTGKWEDAITDYERSLALWGKDQKENAILHHDLGAVYFNTRRFQDALVQFDKATALDPEYAKAYFDKGMTLKFLKQDEKAMEQMKISCELKYLIACVIVKLGPGKE